MEKSPIQNNEEQIPVVQTHNLDWFSKIFRLAMGWKILYGVAKITLALVLLKWATVDPSGIFYKLMEHEIVEDPNDLLIKFVSPFIEHLSVGTTTFAAFYLLFWGIIDDVFLSINILRNKLWAFPVALTLIALFVPYEIYRVFHTHSFILIYIIAIDIAIFWIIAKEYKKEKKRQVGAMPA